MIYELKNDQGRTISTHDSYDDAVTAAEEFAGVDGVVGHDGDLSFGGDKTLIWATEADAENDPGINAIGCIWPAE